MSRLIATFLLCSALLHSGCRRNVTTRVKAPVGTLTKQLQVAPRKTGTLFRRHPAESTGIDLVHRFPTDASSGMLADQSSGAGVCVGDVDGDDLPDVYVTNYDQGNRLYRNLGGFRFEDITAAAGVDGAGRWCAGPSFVDIDNDGDLDLHVCVYAGENLLYVNDGEGSFRDKASEYGLAVNAASVMMSFADYDLDGDLDGYLVTHRLSTNGDKHELPKNSKDAFAKGVVMLDRKQGAQVTPEYSDYFSVMPKSKTGRIALVIAGQEDFLFRNERGVFRSVNREAGISGHGIGLSAVWWDYNNDRRPDLYVSNDYKGADRLYHNNGDGTFSDVVQQLCPHVPWYSMGADVGDVNNDGWLDLFASDMAGTSHYKQKVAMGDMSDDAWFLDLARPPQYMRNAMFINTGGGRMLEIAQMAGISSTDWTWSPKFGDLDNDGWIDLFVANGMSRDYINSDLDDAGRRRGGTRWKDQPVLREPNLAFRNQGDLRFENMGKAWGLDASTASYGASLGDLDRDGDLDLIVTNFEGPLLVYENQSVGNRLLVQLIGRESNRQGIGTRVELATSLGTQTRVLNQSQGFMSSNEPLVHFGLGDASVEHLKIRWPSGREQIVHDIAANQLLTIEESPASGSTSASTSSLESPGPTALFVPSGEFAGLVHQERPFDDFAVQPLLPGKNSQLGPGIACGDVDQDGLDDFYLGAAAGDAGKLVLSSTKQPITLGPNEALFEDMGAVLFDADSDGDLDLYVVSGGVEVQPGHRALQDRLYLQADGAFARAYDHLPELSEAGSCLCAADYDRDGDLDLFVGGYAVPGRYPDSSPSRLFRNDRGKFTDVTSSVASELREARLVRGAVWSDVNGDRAIDLVVAQDWGTIDVFLNSNGQFEKKQDTGIGDLRGWWNGIAGGDLDRDGDIDYVVTNQGLNSKYHASPDHPVRIFHGDFDGTGKRRLVEAKYEQGILLPERGKSCSTAAIPSLEGKFKTYKASALASLDEIYSAKALNQAQSFAANALESGVLLNDGTGRFTFRSLPTLAQVAPADGVIVGHFDGDAEPDVVLAQNDFSPQRETGRMDGGVSLFLRGRGDGTFTTVWPQTSGISVGGDAQCVIVSDLNRDRRPDLVFGVNNDKWHSLKNSESGEFLNVLLAGPSGNTMGVGARVEVLTSIGHTLVQEVYAGSGYLSQSTSTQFFGVDPSEVESVRVLWPDGHETLVMEPTSATRVIHPNLQH